MADTTENCPRSVAIPISVSVNTSGTVPASLTNIHAASGTHGGFTKISEFTFTAKLTGDTLSMQDYISPKLSNTTAVWDFGDGYSLSGTNAITTKHKYRVPGTYTVSMYFYDGDGNAHINTFTESLSIYNYFQTNVQIDTTTTPGLTATDSGVQIPASSKDNSFKVGVSASWQDITPDGKYTMYVTASGSKAKPYDTKNKYAHLIPYNAFYNYQGGELIESDAGLEFELNNHWYVLSGDTIQPIATSKIDYFKDRNYDPTLLGASVTPITTAYNTCSMTNGLTTLEGFNLDSYVHEPHITYYDDIPNTDTGVKLLFKLDTSKHKIKNFYVDEIDSDINSSNRSFLESNSVGYYSTSAVNNTVEGYNVKITKPAAVSASFTSTGMKEMSAINYKRQGDKFQVFIAVADKNANILKLYPEFLKKSTLTSNYSFYTTWSSGGDLHTSVISSISTNKFPYNTSTNNTELSSFLYLNINPLSAGTWTLNITGNVPGLSSQNIGSGNIGIGNVGYGSVGDASTNYLTGAYTFTVLPSTNDVEVYKINEDIDYSQTIKSYRFQSFLHEYDNLFDGIFTSFVGEASSSPTVFGKTVFEKIANFVTNNNDVDYCNMDNLQSFYDLFNEDIDIVLPVPPPELKRLYDLFSIKITKLLGDYERQEQSFNSNFYTSSADSRNIDFNNKITSLTYTVTAYTNFVARQRFNNEFILVRPQNVCSKSVSGANTYILATYPLSTYNEYSNWGWPLDTSVSGASGLNGFYDFYPYTTYATTSANENIKNSIIDFNNKYNTVTRSTSSLSADWENTGGIIYKNLDYQIRKGLSI
tara:strand:+ start:1737 stop:4184 length:2448 start_codon:yes stop_codon:yes gene_type:complete